MVGYTSEQYRRPTCNNCACVYNSEPVQSRLIRCLTHRNSLCRKDPAVDSAAPVRRTIQDSGSTPVNVISTSQLIVDTIHILLIDNHFKFRLPERGPPLQSLIHCYFLALPGKHLQICPCPPRSASLPHLQDISSSPAASASPIVTAAVCPLPTHCYTYRCALNHTPS